MMTWLSLNTTVEEEEEEEEEEDAMVITDADDNKNHNITPAARVAPSTCRLPTIHKTFPLPISCDYDTGLIPPRILFAWATAYEI